MCGPEAGTRSREKPCQPHHTYRYPYSYGDPFGVSLCVWTLIEVGEVGALGVPHLRCVVSRWVQLQCRPQCPAPDTLESLVVAHPFSVLGNQQFYADDLSYLAVVQTE